MANRPAQSSPRRLSPAERERRILEHYPLVRTIACRMAQRYPSCVDVDELVNIGVLGLISALERFDPSRSVPFKAYAEIRIKGAIVDALRGDDWVPRSVRRKQARLRHAVSRLRARLGRAPTRSELAAELELDLDRLEQLLQEADAHRLLSLDAPVDDDGTPLADRISDDEAPLVDRWCDAELRQEVREAIGNLPGKEGAVVAAYYLQGMTLKEIGARLGVTESRACQLRGQGVRRLRYRFRA